MCAGGNKELITYSEEATGVLKTNISLICNLFKALMLIAKVLECTKQKEKPFEINVRKF